MNRRNALLSVAITIAGAMSAQTAVPEGFALIAERVTPDSIPSLEAFKVDCTEGYTILGKNTKCFYRVSVYYDNELLDPNGHESFEYVTHKWVLDEYNYEQDIEVDDPYWEYDLGTRYNHKGHLTNLRVRFPEGYLNIKNDSTEETFLSPGTDFLFNLTDHKDYILSPNNDVKVTVWPQEITLTFPNAKSARLTDNAAASVRKTTMGVVGSIEIEKISLETKDNTVTFRYNTEINGRTPFWEGYFIRIDAGSLEFDFGDWKSTNEELIVGYPDEALTDVIYDMADKKFTNESDLYEFRYSLDESEYAYLYDFDRTIDLPVYLITDSGREEIAHYKSYSKDQAQDNETRLQLTKNEDTPLPDGKYVVVVPKNTFYAYHSEGYDLYNNPAEVYFELDTTGSVNGIFGQEDTYTVYTAQGICVMRQGTRSAYEALPVGLYIVNGKKLIKK